MLGQEAAAFAQKLLAIRDGSNGFKSAVPIEREWLLDSDDLPSLIGKVYPSLATKTNPISFDGRAILASKNDQVDAINDKAAAIFPGESQVYESCDSISDSDDPQSDSANYPMEFLHSIKLTGMPNHTLEIKEGMPLIITRNLDVNNGLCNGTKAYVTRLQRYSIAVRLVMIHNLSSPNDNPFTYIIILRHFFHYFHLFT
ncbi:hypothetical protein [Absidia glauca]|uniref:DNA helicase Pif1-like 2B domain-containing protein n=1 Tax=Absidia glauca TaxID=4829 RepID=A0A168SV76_ABSGL|nr:hypothetical protein [Absidia glauca]